MVLHGGDMVIHTWVKERQHDLFFHKGQSVNLIVWFPTKGILVGGLRLFESLDFLNHQCEHVLCTFVFTAAPSIIHPFFQFFMPVSKDFQHKVDTFLSLKRFLLIHDFNEMFF